MSSKQVLFSIWLICLFVPLRAQNVGTNVNMVTGTQWPGGDPFLQRQNEPSMAISSRNPLHMLAGANDYRTVDLPGVSDEAEPTGDAWLGLFKSFDGGQTWTSTLVPGYPQDQSLQGLLSPLKGLGAAADPGVRAGTNGMFYYSGLAFNRQSGGISKVFVARFIDDNNLEGGDTIRYLGTSILQSSPGTNFLDKPSIAVDIPRHSTKNCTISGPQGSQSFPAGPIYVAYSQFTSTAIPRATQIQFVSSSDCGASWTNQKQISGPAPVNQGAAIAVDPKTGYVYVVWRVFTSPGQLFDALMYSVSYNQGQNFTNPTLIAKINPFDEGDTAQSFRTNAYPAIAVDPSGNLNIAWSQRAVGPGGDARIVLVSGKPASQNPLQFSPQVTIDPSPNRGHQIMPAMAFSAGKLTVAWYDLRDDDLIATYTPQAGGPYFSALENDGGQPDFPMFGTFIQDPIPDPVNGYPANARRQTMDVRAAQAPLGYPPLFLPSVQVSQYAFGSCSTPGSCTIDDPNRPNLIQQLEVNAPNLPMFMTGTLPFMGDYIDVAGPTFIANHDGTWRYNNLSTDPDFTHVVWTDNRNVVQPGDGDWSHYTPPTYGNSTTSIFDPTKQRPACTVMNSGTNTSDRNQDIYTAQLSPGLVVSARGNAKQLGAVNGQPMQREFPITVQNTTAQDRFYRLTINSQPIGGSASFLQFQVAGLPFPFTQIEIQVPALSSVSRSMFVTAADAHAMESVSVMEISGINGPPVPGGQTGAVAVNTDISNPNISNPNISNAEIYNPNISNPNISNPNISNPNISNPNISNPNISNPNISNTVIANPNISNPNISNPNISNPNISNPNISNPSVSDTVGSVLTDVTWTVRNTGNTATAYTVKMLSNGQPVPQGVTLQLIISQSYNTPQVIGCTQAVQQHFVPVANIPNVTLYNTVDQLAQPAAADPNAPALSLLPNETAFVTIRDVDTNTTDPATALADFNPALALTPAAVSQGANTGSSTPPIAVPAASPFFLITTTSLPTGQYNSRYSPFVLSAFGGTLPYTWSLGFGGVLPVGMILDPLTGTISGTPGQAGVWSVPLMVTDSASNSQTANLQLTIGLATGYAGTKNQSPNGVDTCYMPYPTTPMFYLDLGTSGSWSVPAPDPFASQMTFLPGTNILTGCLHDIPSDNTSASPYMLQFSINGGTFFSLPLTVVGTDRQDNGTYFFSSASTDAPLSPNSTEQGVVTVGNTFSYSVSKTTQYGADTSPFTGNFLFGLNGAAPNCVSSSKSTASISLTPTQAGRYDILFDGTTATCPASFPTIAPLPFGTGSVDAISSSVTFPEVTTSNATISTSAPKAVPQSNPKLLSIEQQPGTSPIPVNVKFNYTILRDPACSDCPEQIQVGLNSDTGPQMCPYSAVPASGGDAGFPNVPINVPNIPGRYYIEIDRGLGFGCSAQWGILPGTPGELGVPGVPNIARAIAIVDVWAK